MYAFPKVSTFRWIEASKDIDVNRWKELHNQNIPFTAHCWPSVLDHLSAIVGTMYASAIQTKVCLWELGSISSQYIGEFHFLMRTLQLSALQLRVEGRLIRCDEEEDEEEEEGEEDDGDDESDEARLTYSEEDEDEDAGAEAEDGDTGLFPATDVHELDFTVDLDELDEGMEDTMGRSLIKCLRPLSLRRLCLHLTHSMSYTSVDVDALWPEDF